LSINLFDGGSGGFFVSITDEKPREMMGDRK
jgi:hypothetical protein